MFVGFLIGYTSPPDFCLGRCVELPKGGGLKLGGETNVERQGVPTTIRYVGCWRYGPNFFFNICLYEPL